MDDANLSKLSIDTPGLKPEFNKDILDYSITVPFSVQCLKVKAISSDRGASCTIKSDTGFGDQVKLNEGDNKIKIEVTSEDGTIKVYMISCSRLSASNALLNILDFDTLSVQPEFEPGHFDYELYASAQTQNIKLKVSSLDPNCDIQVKLNDKAENKNANGQYNLNLNYTYSHLIVSVFSANKSMEQNYSIKIFKSPLIRLCILDDSNNDHQDSVSLAPIITPVSFDKINYSKPIIDALRNICNPDGLSLLWLSIQNSSSTISVDLENQISNLNVKIPFLNGLYSKQVCLKEMSSLNEEISRLDKMTDLNEEYKNFKSEKFDNFINPTEPYQTKMWEKQLQIIYDEADGEALYAQSKLSSTSYLSVVQSEKSRKKIKSNDNDSAIYLLNKSIFESATAIKFNSKHYEYHFWLAQLLEEKNFFENIYGPQEQK
ncbi:hypothetical protein BpHYR1_019176 [Brachionus plicatilis]|uniref:Cadherin-like beta-sandwich-like domain-containing protein n=1 Tax=Brachionus plicatilis TaxID=10195 RepID=A0A3M7QRY7_BRAPC|nr:hypothetical protein BpHYR1_019176 [Brachionus plicatilis]